MNPSPVHAIATATIALDNLHCTGCADAVGRTLRANPHISHVHLDWAHNTVHVRYHPERITLAQIETLIASTGCDCTPEPDRTQSEHAARHAGSTTQPSEAGRLEQLRHAVDVQPITMGTKHDRMQYELPATDVYARHHAHVAGQPQTVAAASALEPDGHAEMQGGAVSMEHQGQAGTHHGAPSGVAPIDHSAHATLCPTPAWLRRWSATCAPSSSSRSF